MQDYLVQVVNHPVLQGSEELCLFLTAPGDLAACSRWQRMVQRPPAMDALLGFRRAEASNSTTTTTTTTVPTSTSSSSSSNAAAADGGSAAPGGAGWGVTMMRMRQSLMHVVQHKAQPELSADEQQLRQAKEWLKCVPAFLAMSANDPGTVTAAPVSHPSDANDDALPA